MKVPKEYVFKKKGMVFELILTFISLTPVVLLLVTLFREPIIMLFIGLIPGTLLYFQIYTIRIIRQFNKYDIGKKIIISDSRLTLTLIYKGNVTEIKNSDVERVEIYEQKSLGKFGTYNY